LLYRHERKFSIGLWLSLHRLLSWFQRYCATTLTTTNALIVEKVLSAFSFSIQLRYFVADTVSSRIGCFPRST
ncbi:hypothetical protein QLT09_10580, partial [Streptococcus equi subsp. zooepidemicus]|uniref:hypothetical protein n=1 Tax=Streptococcus equi TaxID=1336 RepID=UPI0024A914A5